MQNCHANYHTIFLSVFLQKYPRLIYDDYFKNGPELAPSPGANMQQNQT
jgi:hypothetical protein